MNKIEKNKILKIVSECAIKYKENLANRQDEIKKFCEIIKK